MAGVISKLVSFFDLSRGLNALGVYKNLSTGGQPDSKLFQDLLATTFLKKYDNTDFQDVATFEDITDRVENKVVTPENMPTFTGSAVTEIEPDVDHPYYRYTIKSGKVNGSVWKNNGGAGQYNLEAGKFNIIVHSASNIEMFLPAIEEDAEIIVQGTTQGGVGSVNFTINGIENSGADLGTPLSVTITDEKEVLVFFCNYYGWHLISRTNPSAATSIPVYNLSQQSSGSSTYDVTIEGVTDRTKLPDQYFIILDAVSAFPLGYTIAMNVNGSFYEDIYKGFNPEKFQEAPQAGFKYLVTKLGSDSYLTIAPNYSDALFDANGGVLPINKLESNSSSTPLVFTSVNGINSFQPPQVLGELLYYFTSTASDVASSYKQTTEPQVGGTTLSFAGLANDQLITKFYSEPNNPNRLSIPAGTYQSHLHAYKSAGTKNLAFRVEVWEVDSAGVDIAKIVDIGNSNILGGSLSEQLTATSVSTEYSLTSRTSRICHKYYAVVTSGGSAPTMAISFGGGNDSHSNLPAPIVDSSNFVPYTGMSTDLNTGTKDIVYENATANTPAWFDGAKKFISATYESFGDWFNSAANKTLPVDGDKIAYLDSTTSFGIVKITLLNLWNNYLKPKYLAGGTLTGALNEAPEVSLVSANTLNIGGANSANILISGNTGIGQFDNVANGIIRYVRFSGTPIITHSALILLPNQTSLQIQAGDQAIFKSLGSGNWICVNYIPITSLTQNFLLKWNAYKLIPSTISEVAGALMMEIPANSSKLTLQTASNQSDIALFSSLNTLRFFNYAGTLLGQISCNSSLLDIVHNTGASRLKAINDGHQVYVDVNQNYYANAKHVFTNASNTQIAQLDNNGFIIGSAATISSSAILQTDSTTQGILIPRMTSAQKLAIGSPATGLLIYQTDGVVGFYYYTGSVWFCLGAISGLTTNRLPKFDGAKFVDSLLQDNGTTVGIGATTAGYGFDLSAMSGFSTPFPVLTTAPAGTPTKMGIQGVDNGSNTGAYYVYMPYAGGGNPAGWYTLLTSQNNTFPSLSTSNASIGLALSSMANSTSTAPTATFTGEFRNLRVGSGRYGIGVYQAGNGYMYLNPYDGMEWSGSCNLNGYLADWDGATIASTANGGKGNGANNLTGVFKIPNSTVKFRAMVNTNSPYLYLSGIVKIDGNGNISSLTITQPSTNTGSFNCSISLGKLQFTGSGWSTCFFICEKISVQYGNLYPIADINEAYSADGNSKYWVGTGGFSVGSTISSDSIFDAKSTTKASRPCPEYTYTAMNALTSINDGAFVSVISSGANNGLYRYNGTTTTWQLLSAGGGGGGGSGITRSVLTISTNTTLPAVANTDYVVFLSGAITVTFPTAVGNTNNYTFIKTDTGTTTTLATTSSQTIAFYPSAPSTTATLTVQGTAGSLMSDGSNWWTI